MLTTPLSLEGTTIMLYHTHMSSLGSDLRTDDYDYRNRASVEGTEFFVCVTVCALHAEQLESM